MVPHSAKSRRCGGSTDNRGRGKHYPLLHPLREVELNAVTYWRSVLNKMSSTYTHLLVDIRDQIGVIKVRTILSAANENDLNF